MDDATPVSAPAPSAASRMLTPLDIQQKEFRVSRFGGYKMRDVDEFLDQLTDSMSAVADGERAAARRRRRPPRSIGTADLDDVDRQADEIIAAGPRRGGADRRGGQSTGGDRRPERAPRSPADRAAVDAFLAQEREFLQSLAGLVQGHAETVKGMAKAARQTPARYGPGGRRGPAAEPRPTTSPPRARPRHRTPPRPRPPTRRRRRAEPRAATHPRRASPSGSRSRSPPRSAARMTKEPEGDRSLRELFWGED